MSTTPRTETTALIAAMEHWAKTVAKNGGVAAVTIQEGADRLSELKDRAELAEASAKLWEADALRYANNTEFWKDRAEKAEAEVERLTKHCSALEVEVAVLSEGLSEDHAIYIAKARAEKAEAELETEREKVRVLRGALKVLVENGGIGPESMFDNAREALVITREAIK